MNNMINKTPKEKEHMQKMIATAYASLNGRKHICEAFKNPINIMARSFNIARQGLQEKAILPDEDLFYRDEDVVYIESNGGVPKHGPCLILNCFEICGSGEHSPDILLKPNAFDVMFKLQQDAAKEIRAQEEANFFTMACLAKPIKFASAAKAIEGLVKRGATSIAYSKLIDKECPEKYMMPKGVETSLERGRTWKGVPLEVTSAIPMGTIYGFVGKVGDLIIKNQIYAQVADQPTANFKSIKKYGYIFKETVGMIITKPKNILKAVLK